MFFVGNERIYSVRFYRVGEVKRLRSCRTGPVESSAMVWAVDIDRFAHFEKARSCPSADAIFEVFASLVNAIVGVIGGKDGEFTVVVACIYDMSERILHPIGRFRRAEFVEN